MNEISIKKELMQLAAQNADVNRYICFLGAGAYNHWVPSTVDHLVGRSEFYTAYTPYQPEVSQGTLQTVYEFQSWMCRLTGLDVANASLYDGATAMAEAALMAIRLNRRNEITLANEVHPAYRQVLETYLAPHAVRINSGTHPPGDNHCLSVYPSIPPLFQKERGDRRDSQLSEGSIRGVSSRIENTAAVIVQQPSFTGDIIPVEELQSLSNQAHEAGALFVVCVDPISLAILPKPAEYGADIVVGEGQPLGMHLSYGGPYLGFIACRETYLRQMPGRIIGETVDTDGKRGFVLTMQTREQHIRREKATSNICSNEALCALSATIYLSLLGGTGLKEVAEICKQKADTMKAKLTAIDGIEVLNQGETFKEFAVCFSSPEEDKPVGTHRNASKPVTTHPSNIIQTINRNLFENNIIGGYELSPDKMLIAVTEMVSDGDIDKFVTVVRNTVACGTNNRDCHPELVSESR